MKRSLSVVFGAIVLSALLSAPVGANDKFAIGPRAGTLGAGGAVHYDLGESFNVRGGFNIFEIGFDREYGDIDYDAEFDWLSFDILLDWFPFANGFHVTTGLLVNQNEVDLTARPGFSSITIGDTTYTSSQIGSLKGDVKFNDVGPYLGIGWGNPFNKESSWSINFDLGVFYQGSPEANFSATGSSSNLSAFLTDLANELSEIEDEIEDYQFYPVVAISALYKF